MKRTLIVAGLLVLLFMTSLYAETKLVRVDIPFKFVAGDQAFPAGLYRVTVDPVANRLEFRRADGAAGGYLSVCAAYRPGAPDLGRLLFHGYGNAYFLHAVWAAGRTWGHEAPRSKAEREMAKAVPAIEIAWLRAESK